MSARRPKRGGGGSTDRSDRNILVSGGEGEYHPQGGAEPGATKAGSLEAREFGVPQADLPGGVRHIVNPQQPAMRTVPKPERPADYHKYHGVPSDDGQYTVPEAHVIGLPRSEPEPAWSDAVPVYMVASPGRHVLTRSFPRRIAVPASTGVPVRLCGVSDERSGVLLLNESATIVRIGETEIDASTRGAALPASMTNYLWIATQDSIYAIADSGASALTVSVIEEYGQPWTH